VKFGEATSSFTCSRNRTRDCSPLGADSYTIPDPREMVKAALPGVADLAYQIGYTETQMQVGMWSGMGRDAVSIMAMPISLMQQAVENMGKIRVIGDRVIDQERTRLIFTILSIVFMIIPFVGQALAVETAVFLQIAGRIIALIGAVGNAGLAIYDSIQDPLMVPIAILASLASGVGRGGRDIEKLADARRAMKPDDIGKLDEVFKRNDRVVQDPAGVCKLRRGR
jgi:chitinase